MSKKSYHESRIKYWQSELDRMDEHHAYAVDHDPAENPVSRYRAHVLKHLEREQEDLEEIEGNEFDAIMAGYALNREDELGEELEL